MEKEDDRPELIKSTAVIYDNFPKQGVKFIDIFPIVGHPQIFKHVIDIFAERLEHLQFDQICMLESKGFLFAPSLSVRVQKPCFPLRKKGKLPGECELIAYGLQYGKDEMEIQKSIIKKGEKIVILDDVLATGGSMNAAIELVERLGGEVVQVLFLNDIKVLDGKSKLKVSQDKIFTIYHT